MTPLGRFDIHSDNEELSNALQKFWDIESLGVRGEPFESRLDTGKFPEEHTFRREGKKIRGICH